jgi:hypothetical protein
MAWGVNAGVKSTETSRFESTSNQAIRECLSPHSEAKNTQKRPKKTMLCSPSEEDPCEEERTFKPADLMHFQDGHDMGRRVSKTIENSGDWDYTYHYYHNGQSTVEDRNGNGQVIRQYVWGLTYIDELLQVGLNQDPGDGESAAGSAGFCERFFYACLDEPKARSAWNANFDVLGLTRAVAAIGVSAAVGRHE